MKFNIGDVVEVKATGEVGRVLRRDDGFTGWSSDGNEYEVRFESHDKWYSEHRLKLVSPLEQLAKVAE